MTRQNVFKKFIVCLTLLTNFLFIFLFITRLMELIYISLALVLIFSAVIWTISSFMTIFIYSVTLNHSACFVSPFYQKSFQISTAEAFAGTGESSV